MQEFSIDADDQGMRLDRWFKRRFPQITHGVLEKALRKGDIRLEGEKAQSASRLNAGQRLTIRYLPPMPERVLEAPKPRIRVTEEDKIMLQEAVLYRDAEILILNKPAGLAVQGGSGVTRSVDFLLDALRFDASERPKLVHRLDRDTSGVLALARSTQAARRLMPLFAGKTVQKTYWALVKGTPERREDKIDLALSKQESDDIEKVTLDPQGKRAVTLYRVIEGLGDALSFVELTPVTGRTHQLRVHMAAIGHPILGDGKYGGRDAFIQGMELPRQLHLHARRLHVPKWFDVAAPLPAHMQESFKLLGIEEEEI